MSSDGAIITLKDNLMWKQLIAFKQGDSVKAILVSHDDEVVFAGVNWDQLCSDIIRGGPWGVRWVSVEEARDVMAEYLL